jgi:hypothetical protein
MRPLIASGDALPRYGGREAHGRSCLDLADSVAKVVLPKVSKILRAAGAFFV